MNDFSSPKVSIIIPSRTGDISRPMVGIKQQTFRDYEIIVIKGVSPAARARNLGALQAKSEILLFVDDDASFGHDNILTTMIHILESDEQTAIVGISQQIPINATSFQQQISLQVPRYTYPIVTEHKVSNPPLDRFGFTAITTLCCAVRRSVFEEVKGFREDLLSGEDTDFFYRVHRQRYNLIVAANCWVYHDPPKSMKTLLRKSFWYGIGHALEARMNPERHMDLIPLKHWYGWIVLAAAILGFPGAFFVHYYFDSARKLVIGFRPLKTLSTYAGLCGYVYGWYRQIPITAPTLQKIHVKSLADTSVKI